MAELSPLDWETLNSVAERLGIGDSNWLYQVIKFETAGTFDPKISNPRSSAKGLIQFIDSTARDLGYDSSLDLVTKNPTFIKQMEGPVYQYFKNRAPYPIEEKLYLKVFYPAALNYPLDTAFTAIFQDRHGANWEKEYRKFSTANPGINTPLDYVNMIKKKSGLLVKTAKAGSLILIAAIAAAVLYFTLQKKK
jgi:hypothetical protein